MQLNSFMLALSLFFSFGSAFAANPMGLGWKMTFEDEFDDPSIAIARGTPAYCFSISATCIDHWNSYRCAPEYQAQLANLNKCNWRVYDQYNWMDQGAKDGQGFNALHPSQVKVEGGLLHLTAVRAPGDPSQRSCKNPFFDPALGAINYTKDCEILSGAIQSSPFNNHGRAFGFQQTFGRFEVRAKVSHGPGSWPAAWILASELENGCGWPHNGELDLVEAWGSSEGRAYSTYHDGICDQSAHLSQGFERSFPNGSLYDQFHTFAVEWDATSVEFLIDNEPLGKVEKDQLVTGKLPDGTESLFGARIPSGPFFWILNNTILRINDPNEFKPQDFVIDAVRTYTACTPADPSEHCVKFFKASPYNSYRNETAKMNISAFPSPVERGQTASIHLTSFQACKQVQLELISPQGSRIQNFSIPSSFQMNEQELKTFQLNTANLPSGMNFIHARFEGCGPTEKGAGNETFKLLVL